LQVQFADRAEEEVAEAVAFQAAHQRGTSQAEVSGDVDFAVLIHHSP
jgi:butyrate kinase